MYRTVWRIYILMLGCKGLIHVVSSFPLYIPGKNIGWDPANPTWDPRCVPGGILPFSGGIPGGIMEHPAWDPTWDYGTSRVGSRVGLWNIPHGIPPGIMEHPAWDPTWDYGTSHMGSHMGLWNIPHGIPPGIMEHPPWDPTWDPAN